MKKFFQLSVALIAVFAFTCAQPAHSQLNFGLKGGLSLANIGGDDAEDTDMRSGIHAGPFLEISLLGLISMETGAYFSQKGYSTEFEEGIDDFTFRYEENVRFTYLDIPAVVKFSPLPLLHFYAGPQLSFLIDNEFEETITGPDGESITTTISDTDLQRSTDLAVVLGAGINLPIGLTASIGYDVGLLSAFDLNGNDVKIYNRVIKFSVGYRF